MRKPGPANACSGGPSQLRHTTSTPTSHNRLRPFRWPAAELDSLSGPVLFPLCTLNTWLIQVQFQVDLPPFLGIFLAKNTSMRPSSVPLFSLPCLSAFR